MKIINYHFYINLKTKNQLQNFIKKQQNLILYIMNVVKEDMVVIHDAINFGQFSEDFKAGKLKDYNMSYQKYQEY